MIIFFFLDVHYTLEKNNASDFITKWTVTPEKIKKESYCGMKHYFGGYEVFGAGVNISRMFNLTGEIFQRIVINFTLVRITNDSSCLPSIDMNINKNNHDLASQLEEVKPLLNYCNETQIYFQENNINITIDDPLQSNILMIELAYNNINSNGLTGYYGLFNFPLVLMSPCQSNTQTDDDNNIGRSKSGYHPTNYSDPEFCYVFNGYDGNFNQKSDPCISPFCAICNSKKCLKCLEDFQIDSNGDCVLKNKSNYINYIKNNNLKV
jgi:hypothetical protein